MDYEVRLYDLLQKITDSLKNIKFCLKLVETSIGTYDM
jgi:hypothetical protein